MSFSSFFSKLQESPWYDQFLTPVVDMVSNEAHILDIGTGSGKMLQILSQRKNVTGVGIDTDTLMLEEAQKKLLNLPMRLQHLEAGKNYPFEDKHFDIVTICNVLFNVKEKPGINQILSESLRVLKPNGKLIILTPTGGGNVLKLSRHFFSLKNKGIYTWYHSTKRSALRWTKEQYLLQYSEQKDLTYTRTETLHGFAQLETLSR